MKMVQYSFISIFLLSQRRSFYEKVFSTFLALRFSVRSERNFQRALLFEKEIKIKMRAMYENGTM